MWIARDNNKQLFVFTDKPVRNEYDLIFDGGECLELNGSEFPEVTWENSPIEIKIASNKGISIDWEQRRYEIAKDVLAASSRHPDSRISCRGIKEFVVEAVVFADELIKELKK